MKAGTGASAFPVRERAGLRPLQRHVDAECTSPSLALSMVESVTVCVRVSIASGKALCAPSKREMTEVLEINQLVFRYKEMARVSTGITTLVRGFITVVESKI